MVKSPIEHSMVVFGGGSLITSNGRARLCVRLISDFNVAKFSSLRGGSVAATGATTTGSTFGL